MPVNPNPTEAMLALPAVAFVREQVILMQPLTIFVWGTGLVCLFILPALKKYRSLGWCYIAILALFIIQGGKPYYLAPAYTVLFAAGGIAIERFFAKKWLRIGIAAAILAAGISSAPLGMPLLPVESFIEYQTVLGIRPSSGERSPEGELPSFFANMFGWQN